MGKRSSFKRIDKDFYPTIDPRAVKELLPHLPDNFTYAEPCVGEGHMVRWLSSYGFKCTYQGDISTGQDAMNLTAYDIGDADIFISNLPWSRDIFEPMVEHLTNIKPLWTLLDAGWVYTARSAKLVEERLTDIVALPRLKWIENTTMSSKDDCCWLRFDKNKQGNINFYGRKLSR